MPKRIIASIEARMGSTRLPGKVLLPVGGTPVLSYMISRVQMSTKITDIIVATTDNPKDDMIEDMCNKMNIKVFRGNEENVLERVFKATQSLNADIIVELTGDCPLIDPDLIDHAVSTFLINHECDYLYNREYEGYPDGMDIQVFTSKAFKRSRKIASTRSELEHVSLQMRNDPTLRKIYLAPVQQHNRPDLELTLDVPEDYELIKDVIEYFQRENRVPSLTDIIHYLDNDIEAISNTNIKRKSYPSRQ